MKWLMILAAALAASGAQAQVYKCTEGGKTVFSDLPCNSSAKVIDARPALGPTKSSYQELLELSAGAYKPLLKKAAPSERLACSVDSDEKARISTLDQLVTRFRETTRVARSTPRIGLGPSMLQMANIKADIDAVEVSEPCALNIKQNAALYAELSLSGIQAFAGKDETTSSFRFLDAATAEEQYARGKKLFGL